MKKIISIGASMLMLIFIAVSCGTSSDVASNKLIQKRKHLKGYHISTKQSLFKKSSLKADSEALLVMQETNHQAGLKIDKELRRDNYKPVESIKMPVTQSSKNTKINATKSANSSALISKVTEEVVSEKNVSEYKTESISKKSKIKPLKDKLKAQDTANSAADDMLILLVILCFLLPPVAVGLKAGWDSKKFIISIILTILVWVPGVIYGLLVVFDII